MGLFDYFKKKTTPTKPATHTDSTPADANGYLLNELKSKLEALHYTVENATQYQAIIVNSEIEIATAIIESPNYHPSLLHLMVATIHPTYFSNGIIENIVGIGETLPEKVESVLHNYLSTTFDPIIDSMSDSHYPELDFVTFTNNREILWHPKLGNLALQGSWENAVTNEYLFELLKEKLKNKLPDQKLNWLKLYVAQQANGEITGECLFNNEFWEEGYQELYQYATQWPVGHFRGQKQFMMFRRCDAHDP